MCILSCDLIIFLVFIIRPYKGSGMDNKQPFYQDFTLRQDNKRNGIKLIKQLDYWHSKMKLCIHNSVFFTKPAGDSQNHSQLVLGHPIWSSWCVTPRASRAANNRTSMNFTHENFTFSPLYEDKHRDTAFLL